MEVHPFNQEGFDGATLEEESGAILGVGQVIHWKDCDRAYRRKQTGGVWFGMPKDGGWVKVTTGYSVYFERGAHGLVKRGVPDRPLEPRAIADGGSAALS